MISVSDALGGEETVAHAPLRCKLSKECWNQSPYAESVKEFFGNSVKEFLISCWLSRSNKEMRAIVVLLWAAWGARNKVLFQKYKSNCQMIFETAEATLCSYDLMHVEPSRVKSNEEDLEQCPKIWCPPHIGWFKVNVDASINHEMKLGGIGVVVRKCEGRVVAGAVQRGYFRDDVEEAEAEVALRIKWLRKISVSLLLLP